MNKTIIMKQKLLGKLDWNQVILKMRNKAKLLFKECYHIITAVNSKRIKDNTRKIAKFLMPDLITSMKSMKSPNSSQSIKFKLSSITQNWT